MNVGQLISLLELQDKNAEVRMSYAYGDRCGRICAPDITAVGEANVKYSEYTQEYCVTSVGSAVAFDDDDDESDYADEPQTTTAVVLFCSETEDF